MRVTVFGATGQIGRLAVHRMLDDGHRVTALVRSPDKLDGVGREVELIESELSDREAMMRAVRGADAVLSALGPPIDPFLRGTPLTDGTRAVLAAMAAADVRRLVALATVSVPDPRDRPGLLERLTPIAIGALIPGALREVQGIHEAVSTSDLDWTVARIFAPIDAPANRTVRSGFLGVDDIGVEMTRADIADFLVDQLTDRRYVGAAPAISN